MEERFLSGGYRVAGKREREWMEKEGSVAARNTRARTRWSDGYI